MPAVAFLGGGTSEPVRSRMPATRLPAAVVAFALCCGLVVACGGSSSSGTPTLKWYVYKEPSGAFTDAAAACTKAAKGRYKVTTVDLPSDADQQREQLVRRLAAKDSDIDIIGMDVIWTAEFANAGWIKVWPAKEAATARAGKLKPAVVSGTFQNRLYAAPFNSNAEMLWYRTELTKQPPKTWDELLATSKKLSAQGKPSLIQAQGQRYEGLVVFFTSLLESAGGTVLNKSGTKVALPTGPTRNALQILKDFSTSKAADPALATAREDDGRLGWEAGKSAFMVNYSFVWPSANANAPAIAKNMRWARYPGVEADRPSHVTIGGFNLGIGSYSKHPSLAFEAASCLTGDANQIVNATKGGLLPVTEKLYDDPHLTKATTDVTDPKTGKTKKVAAFPYADTIKATLATAVQRPQTPYYNDVALAISRTIHPTRSIDPEKDVGRLRDAITKALSGEGLL